MDKLIASGQQDTDTQNPTNGRKAVSNRPGNFVNDSTEKDKKLPKNIKILEQKEQETVVKQRINKFEEINEDRQQRKAFSYDQYNVVSEKYKTPQLKQQEDTGDRLNRFNQTNKHERAGAPGRRGEKEQSQFVQISSVEYEEYLQLKQLSTNSVCKDSFARDMSTTANSGAIDDSKLAQKKVGLKSKQERSQLGQTSRLINGKNPLPNKASKPENASRNKASEYQKQNPHVAQQVVKNLGIKSSGLTQKKYR